MVDFAAFVWDAGNPEILDTYLSIWSFPVTWGPELAMRFKRTLVDGDEALRYPWQPVVDGGFRCDIGSAPMAAPYVSLAGVSSVLPLQEQMQLDPPFLDDIPSLNILDAGSLLPRPPLARPGNLCEVWDAFISSWLGALGALPCLPWDTAGEGTIDILDTHFDPLGVDLSPPRALWSCTWWTITSIPGLNVAPAHLGFVGSRSFAWSQWKNFCTWGACALETSVHNVYDASDGPRR